MATFEPADYKSQQPLGFALSFYIRNIRNSDCHSGNVSTAAWACIEFLPKSGLAMPPAAHGLSQQPLGLALSFYQSFA